MTKVPQSRVAEPLYLGMGVCLAAAVLWLYWPVLVHLVNFLYTSQDYSYGLLLPLVSGYLVFLMWPQLRHLPRRPAWMGLALMIIALAMYFVGIVVAKFLARVSFLVLLVGILLLIFGWQFVWQIKFPLFLLALTIPPPSVFVYKIALPLQILSSQLAAKFLELLGYAVERQGNVIDLGYTQVQVVAACSGLRYILALFALGCIFCYFYQRRLWKVAVLLAALAPTAILANAVRVAGMGIFPALEAGFWHGFSGWLIFLATFGLLMLLNRMLNLLEAPQPQDLATFTSPETENDQARDLKAPLTRYLIAALVVVLLGIGVIRHSLVLAAIPLRQSFQQFPLHLGPWQGQHVPMDPEMIQATWSDAHLNVEYQTSQGKEVSLWIAYYEKDESGGGFKHTPSGCMKGAGWELLEQGVREIAPGYPVDYLVMQLLGDRILVFSWQLWHGQWLTEKKLTEPYLIWDSLARRRNDGAMISLTTPITGDLEKATEVLTEFARLLLPILPKFIAYQQPQNR